MIRYSKGDLFASGCAAIVNPVNCYGVMGAGLAKTVLRLYPKACEKYFEACRERILRPGGIVIAECDLPGGPAWIIHAATKSHWKHTARLWWVRDCLDALGAAATTLRIPSVAVPALGCGLGLLDWDDVRPEIENYLGSYPLVEWRVFEPKG